MNMHKYGNLLIGMIFFCSGATTMCQEIRSMHELQVILTTAIHPVVVKFWMPGCPPCSKMAPIIDRLADIYTQCTFITCNILDAKEIALRYKIISVPTIIIFKHGAQWWNKTGTVSQKVLDEAIRAAF
jgi:thioredoxin 1